MTRRASPVSAARVLRSAAALAALLAAGNGAPVELELTFENLRNERGILQLCLTQAAAHFPDCSSDPAAVKQSVAADSHSLRLTLPEPGQYAVSVLHDANGNARADKLLGIPREGFGFSRNPPIRFGPPRFDSTLIELEPGLTRHTIRLRYIL